MNNERRLPQRELAACLLARVVESPVAAERTSLLNRCLKVCAELAPEKPATDDSRIYGIWGRALILSSQIDNDRMKLRAGADKLATALQLDEQNSEWQYRLATAFALLRQ